MPDILSKTEQVTPFPVGTGIYAVLDPNGSPLDRWGAIEMLAQSPAFSAIYAAFADLPQPAPSPDILWDVVSSPGFLLGELASTIHPDIVELAGAARLASAHMMTYTALPACAYDNAAAGLGATLTASANGAIPQIDLTSVAATQTILVNNQADNRQNGLYEVTDAGSAGTPWILTRTTGASITSDFTDGLVCLVGKGLTNRGRVMVLEPVSVTPGTDGIRFRPAGGQPLPHDLMKIGSDFAGMPASTTLDVAVGGATQNIPGSEWVTNLVGAGTTVTQIGVRRGVISVGTGTTATGLGAVGDGLSAGGGGTFDPTKPYEVAFCIQIPTLSTAGVQEFVYRIGVVDAAILAGTAPQRGAFFEFAADGATINAVQGVGAVFTTTASGVAQGTTVRSAAIRYDPDSGNWLFYIFSSSVWTLVATIANTITGAVVYGAAVKKAVGITDRRVQLDYYFGTVPETRTGTEFIPR